jgi:ParB-like chromosome segregation protein Spo0J
MNIEYLRLDSVEHLPQNAKAHDLGAIIVSIQEFGFVDPIGINQVTNHDLDGNGRLDALRSMMLANLPLPQNIVKDHDGMWLFPAVLLNVPEHKEAALGIALNHINEIGGWDLQILSSVLSDIAARGELHGTGYDTDDVDKLLKDANAPMFPKQENTALEENNQSSTHVCPECGYEFSD